MSLQQLTLPQCETLLSAHHIASLSCVKDGRPYVVPVSYAFSGGFIYSFSREGQKLDWMRANPSVSLLVVDHGSGSTWNSVVVTGSFEEFTKDHYFDDDNDFAWKALEQAGGLVEPRKSQARGVSRGGRRLRLLLHPHRSRSPGAPCAPNAHDPCSAVQRIGPTSA